ncbi:lysozyme [Neorhizobium alkalisoli]|uniref:Lysozyme n=1 Tax=Neorhizobium alkalisoli TaxID=528178 RepID=A0A561Q7V9_9HYPH|nr:lysozyme [Neorhizobium alkalisoli]TWF46429.1 GH24 family phage-related lysozyme (muramidase) [Neorhizobium alkalisoli]
MPINKILPSKRAQAMVGGIVAAAVAGLVAIFPGQPAVHDDTALAIKILQPWEGRSLVAYLDTLPTKPVYTICDGDTDNVRKGMVETHAGCDARTAGKLERDYRPHLVKCVANWDKAPLSWRGSMLTLSWNVGVGATCNSTAVKLAKLGRYRESCEAATAFNKAGGRILKGLVNRREMGDATRVGEGEVCVSGLTP